MYFNKILNIARIFSLNSRISCQTEEMNYPYHYENLEFAEKCYREAIEQKNNYKKSIKFDNDFVGNKAHAIEELLEKKWEKLTADFGKKWEKQYNRQLLLIEKHGKDDRIKKIQKHNLTKEYEKFMCNISLKHTDVFQSMKISVLIHLVQ